MTGALNGSSSGWRLSAGSELRLRCTPGAFFSSVAPGVGRGVSHVKHPPRCQRAQCSADRTTAPLDETPREWRKTVDSADCALAPLPFALATPAITQYIARRRSVAQPGRALLSGGRGRRFKSSHSDQNKSQLAQPG
jgi:hypothetical protein